MQELRAHLVSKDPDAKKCCGKCTCPPGNWNPPPDVWMEVRKAVGALVSEDGTKKGVDRAVDGVELLIRDLSVQGKHALNPILHTLVETVGPCTDKARELYKALLTVPEIGEDNAILREALDCKSEHSE